MNETAIDMILSGECGAFNPILLKCLREIEPQLRIAARYDMGENAYRYEAERLVDPTTNEILEVDDNGVLRRTNQQCARFWNHYENCANCISARALAQKTMLNKLEYTKTDMYYVTARYLCVNGTPCVLEMLSKMNEGRWIDANEPDFYWTEVVKRTENCFPIP